eukprot:gene21437-27468_t
MTRTLSQEVLTTANSQSAAVAGKKGVSFVPPVEPTKTKVKPAVDDKTAEKKKIKAQYEQFMNMKKQSEAHPDNDTVQQ